MKLLPLLQQHSQRKRWRGKAARTPYLKLVDEMSCCLITITLRNQNILKLSATDLLVLASMKNAAKRDR